jgi:hypothetical protein
MKNLKSGQRKWEERRSRYWNTVEKRISRLEGGKKRRKEEDMEGEGKKMRCVGEKNKRK